MCCFYEGVTNYVNNAVSGLCTEASTSQNHVTNKMTDLVVFIDVLDIRFVASVSFVIGGFRAPMLMFDNYRIPVSAFYTFLSRTKPCQTESLQIHFQTTLGKNF